VCIVALLPLAVFIRYAVGTGNRGQTLLPIPIFPMRLNRFRRSVKPGPVLCQGFQFSGAEPFDTVRCRATEWFKESDLDENRNIVLREAKEQRCLLDIQARRKSLHR